MSLLSSISECTVCFLVLLFLHCLLFFVCVCLLSVCFYLSLTSVCLTCFLSLIPSHSPTVTHCLICFLFRSVIHSHSVSLSLTHTNTCMCAHTHMHACTHTHSCMHTHTHFLCVYLLSLTSPSPTPQSLFVSLLHSHFLFDMQTICVPRVQQAHTSMGNMLTAGSEHVATEPASQVNSARGGLWFGLSWPVPLVGCTAVTRAVLPALAVHVVF